MSLSAFNIWQRKYGIHSFKYLLIILTFIGICFLCYQNRILTSSESIFKHIEYRLANDTESRSPSLQPSNDSYNTNISFISAQYMKRMQKTPKSSMVTLGIPIHFQKANIGIFQLQRSLCMHIFGSWMLPKAIYLTLTNLKSAFGSNATILLFRAHANNLFHQIEQITQIKINVFYEYKKVKTPHNRNILSQQSFNDHKDAFLSMFDADDIAHPQRLEIIDYFYRLRIPKEEYSDTVVLHRFAHRKCRKMDETNVTFNQDIASLDDVNHFLQQCSVFTNNAIIYGESRKILNFTKIHHLKLKKEDYIEKYKHAHDRKFNFSDLLIAPYRFWEYHQHIKRSFYWHALGWITTSRSNYLKHPYEYRYHYSWHKCCEDGIFLYDTIMNGGTLFIIDSQKQLGVYCHGDKV
eukprot:871372_1